MGSHRSELRSAGAEYELNDDQSAKFCRGLPANGTHLTVPTAVDRFSRIIRVV